MDYDELLVKSYQVADALDPECRALLASLSQQLDTPVARLSLGPQEFQKVARARSQMLSEALAATFELVERSHYDVQVLVILMRLMVEVESVNGAIRVLQLVRRLLVECWNEREAWCVKQPDREKAVRRWVRYFDAVFEQIYGHFARESEQQTQDFIAAVDAKGHLLLQACRGVDDTLVQHPTLRSSWWSRTSRKILDLANAAPESDEPQRDTAAGVPNRETMTTPKSTDPECLDPVVASAHEVRPNPTSTETTQGGRGRARVEEEEAVLQVSPRFWQLRRGLDALALLLKNGDYEKAGIVAQDLEETLQAFHVTSFFPGLFAPYFELSARYSALLSRSRETDPVRSSALTQLYRTDLDRFLALTLEEGG